MELISKSPIKLNAPVDAKEVEKEFSKISVLTPESIIGRASLPDNPLHKYFEWDDSKAAHQYRLSQARNLVLSIGFTDDEQFIRRYESVVLDDQRMYLPMDEIRKDESLVEQVLQSAIREVLYWKTKHQRYKKFFGGVFDEINKAEGKYRRKYGKEKDSRNSR